MGSPAGKMLDIAHNHLFSALAADEATLGMCTGVFFMMGLILHTADHHHVVISDYNVAVTKRMSLVTMFLLKSPLRLCAIILRSNTTFLLLLHMATAHVFKDEPCYDSNLHMSA